MKKEVYLLGVDGGGTRCRARLCSFSGKTLGEGLAGPANIRIGLEESFAAIERATSECLSAGRLASGEHDIVACLAMAGAGDPIALAALKRYKHPFQRVVFTTDAHAACVGAHGGRDGGVIIVGTGSVAEAVVKGRHHRIGGWGFPVSDEGSGAWLGCELIRRVLWAHDGRRDWTDLLSHISKQFEQEPYAIVRWMSTAKPRDFGNLAPLVVLYAREHDAAGVELMRLAAAHIDVLADRLMALGAPRLALSGGLASSIEPWLGDLTRSRLVPAEADALAGAVELARAEALEEART